MEEKKDKHPGGRPPIYDGKNKSDIDKVAQLCESYFDEVGTGSPPTVTGLTLHLGFENKSTLYDYAKKAEFSNSIKRALTRIEHYHETQVAFGEKCTGNIFVLKNFDWKDSKTIDLGGEITSNQKLDDETIKKIAEKLNDKY